MRTKTIAKLFLTMLIIAFIAPFTLNQANAIINNYIINVDGKVYSGLTEVPGVFDISGSTYTLLGNITGSLTIQKGDIIIDGAGYTFTGSGVGNGIYVYEVNNVTITNINLNNFARLINLQNSEYSKIIACNLTNGMGISLDNSNHTLLTKNTITANSYQGISLIDSSRNTITENSIDSASNGIKIDTIQDTDYKAEYNYIYGNTISSCSNAGIAIQNLASFNTVLNNNVTLCNQGIYLIGNMNGQAYYPHNNSILYNTVTDLDYAAISISSAPYTRIIGNLLNGSEVYGIYLDESWEIDDCDIVTDNTVIDCSIGMMVWTANTTITRNCAIQSEQFALYLLGSNNTIYENIFHSLEGNAIVLEESGNNAIYHNDFFQESGSITVYSSGANIWDNGYPAGGNFWSFLTPDDEYSGAEQDADGSDGIIDTPFTITGDNIDNYPLVKPCNFFAMNITTTEGGTVNPFTGLVYTPKFAIGNQRLNPTIFTNTSYSEPGSLNYNVTQDGSFVVLVMATGYKGPVEEVTVPQGFTQQLFVNGTANCQQVYIATGTQQAGSYVFSATCQNDGEVDYSMAAYVFPPGYYSFVTAGIAPDLDGNYPQSTALSLSSGSYCIFGAGADGAPPSISMSTDVIDVSCRDPTLEHNLSVIGHQYSRNITLTGYPYLALGGIGITKALSVTATPEGENTFSHWILNGEKVTENPLQLNQTSNQDLTAVFKPPHVLGNWTYAGNDLNAGTSIIQTSDGGYVIAGYSSSYKETYDYDFWLAKISSNGIMQWNHTYGSDAYDYAYSLTESQDGGYVIAGGTPEGAGGIDVWILKTDANGNQVWNKTYGYNKNDGAYGILPLQGGGYMVAGYTTNADFSSDMWLIKIDDSGNQVWNKTYGVALSDEVCYGIVDASGGGYVLAGYTYLWSGETGQDVWLVKVDADGKQLWNQTYGGLTYEEATSIVATEDNGYAVAGFGGSWGERYALLMKVDANGVQDWNQTYGGIADTQVFSLINAQDSGYVLAGFTQIASDKQALLIKTYPNGTEQWKRTYGTEDNDDIARCVIATEEDGYAFTGSEGSDCMLYVVDSNGYIAEPQTYYLTINKNGQGTVTPNSQGYEEGTVVDLEAIPANGWSFSGWSGDVQGSTATTTITMNANKTVTATFTQNNAPPSPPQSYSVIFSESGLEVGNSWTVTFNGVSKTATTNTITFEEIPNGNYQYTLTLPQGYITNNLLTGSLTVNSHDHTMAVTFQKLYTVVFNAPNLPEGAQWNVTLNGETRISTDGVVVFQLTTGEYNYIITLPAGYTATTALTGTITVSGNTQQVTVQTIQAPPTPTPTPTTTPIMTPTPTSTPTTTTNPTPTPTANSNLTIIQPTGGQVTASNSFTTENGTKQVTITATANEGYTFAYWLLDGQRVDGDGSITVPANEQHSLQAIFQTTADITPTATPTFNGFEVTVAVAVIVIVFVFLGLLVYRRKRKNEEAPN